MQLLTASAIGIIIGLFLAFTANAQTYVVTCNQGHPGVPFSNPAFGNPIIVSPEERGSCVNNDWTIQEAEFGGSGSGSDLTVEEIALLFSAGAAPIILIWFAGIQIGSLIRVFTKVPEL